MTHGEQRIYLIQELLAEDARYRDISIPSDEQGQKDLLRSLMNIRMPKPISRDFLAIQDEYLQEERDMRGITESEKLPSISGNPRIALWQGDITTLKADAIVNAANSGMLGCFHPLHSCIDNIIGTMSGIQLRLYCHDMMRKQGHEEPTGQAKITPAFNLPSKYILHTVGPIIRGAVRKQGRAALASCYRSCLELAGRARACQCGLLLHLHRGVPLPQPGGRRNRRGDRSRLPPAGHFHSEGDFQCVQRS